MDSDFFLIRKMRSGDDSAGDRFVQKYYKDIVKYCSYHCNSLQNAQDMTQETFIRFFSNLATYEHDGKVKNYLYTIARNLCIDASRQKKECFYLDLPEQKEYGKEDKNISQKETQLTLQWALEKLPEDYQQVLILYYFQEFKIREISDLLNITVPLTKYRLKQGKEKLKELLKKEDFHEA